MGQAKGEKGVGERRGSGGGEGGKNKNKHKKKKKNSKNQRDRRTEDKQTQLVEREKVWKNNKEKESNVKTRRNTI